MPSLKGRQLEADGVVEGPSAHFVLQRTSHEAHIDDDHLSSLSRSVREQIDRLSKLQPLNHQATEVKIETLVDTTVAVEMCGPCLGRGCVFCRNSTASLKDRQIETNDEARCAEEAVRVAKELADEKAVKARILSWQRDYQATKLKRVDEARRAEEAARIAEELADAKAVEKVHAEFWRQGKADEDTRRAAAASAPRLRP